MNDNTQERLTYLVVFFCGMQYLCFCVAFHAVPSPVIEMGVGGFFTILAGRNIRGALKSREQVAMEEKNGPPPTGG